MVTSDLTELSWSFHVSEVNGQETEEAEAKSIGPNGLKIPSHIVSCKRSPIPIGYSTVNIEENPALSH